jgi:hypothetical protein
LLQNNKQLNSLSLNIDSTTVEFDLLSILADYCPATVRMCHLYFTGAFYVRHVVRLLLNNRKLTHCYIQNSSNIVFDYLHLSDVKQVKCKAVNFPEVDHNLGQFFTLIFGFTHIELIDIYELTDTFLRAIVVKNYSTLNHLTIGYCEVCWSGHAISYLLGTCKGLIILQLLDCSHCVDEDFVQFCLADNCLTKLTLNNALTITTPTLMKLLAHCKCLVMFHAENCDKVNKSDIQEYCEVYRPDIELYPRKGVHYW